MSSAKRKCRQYSVSYLQYGFIPVPHSELLQKCLLCNKVFSNEAMKPSRLSEHLTKIHPDKVDKSAIFFQCLRDNFKQRKTSGSMFASSCQKSVDGLPATYNLSLMLAKKGKPNRIGEELILPAVKEVLNTVLHHKACSSVIKSIPLSNDDVQRRIDEMSADVEHKLCKHIEQYKI